MTKKILILFGLLDIFSFVVHIDYVVKILEEMVHFPIINIPEIILIVSLLVSGVLSILRKKTSLIIYYFQFPLRITFMIVTFGFLFKILGFQYNSVGYKVVMVITFLLEILRLIITITIQKKENKKTMPSPNIS